MTPVRKTITFRIDDELIDGLQTVWNRDGVAVSEQIRRAIREWLNKKGLKAQRPHKAATGPKER
jgi:hypothetical protein